VYIESGYEVPLHRFKFFTLFKDISICMDRSMYVFISLSFCGIFLIDLYSSLFHSKYINTVSTIVKLY